MNGLISIIIPVYNAEKYILNCVESLIIQSYRNFELILVNDGSQDNSSILCKSLSLRDNRIKVINRENGGASAARNTGLMYVKGDYIIFVDSDDYVSENYLENLYLAAKLGDYDIVQCNLEKTSELLKDLVPVKFIPADVKEITKIQALNDRFYKVSVWGKIYSSSIFMDFQFKEGIIYEDDASYYILVDRANKIAVLNETLYYYFMSDNSVMRNNKQNKSVSFIQIYEDRIQYFSLTSNQALLEGTYSRYCLVLMLTTSKALIHKNNEVDIERFIELFKLYYPKTMRAKTVRKKDKIMFSCFQIAPKIVGRIIGVIRK